MRGSLGASEVAFGANAAILRAAMSQENVEALRPVYEEWGRGNWTPRFGVYADDMEWGWSDEFPGLGGVEADPELISSRLRAWLSPWEDWRCEAEEFVVAGDHVVVLTRYRGRGKGSKVTVDTRGAHLWTLRNGKAMRLEVFSSRERALAAAGIE
jgi:ketosteroid isomerase-like protein